MFSTVLVQYTWPDPLSVAAAVAVAAAAVAAASGSMVAAPRPCGTAALRQHGRGGMCVVVAAHRGGGGGYSTSTIVELQYEYAVARLPSRDFLALSRTLFFFYVWLEPREPRAD